jgi:hypothetical protein
MFRYELSEHAPWSPGNLQLERDFSYCLWRSDERVQAEYERLAEGRPMCAEESAALFLRLWERDPNGLRDWYSRRVGQGMDLLRCGQRPPKTT